MKILIVKLTSFGDVIHTFPAITDLRAARPDIEIDWLVEEAFAPFVALHPAISTIHSGAFRRLRSPPSRWPLLPVEADPPRPHAARRRYDLVVDMQGLLKSALPALLAGAGSPATTRRAPANRPRAASIAGGSPFRGRCMRSSGAAGCLPRPSAIKRRPGRGVSAWGAGRQRPAGWPERYAIAMHSASWETKLWPERNWRALLAEITAGGARSSCPGARPDEKARAERLAVDIDGVHVLPDVLSGADLARVIGGADFAIGLDSGLMHLATALDVPGIWLFGPTDPGLTGPYGKDQTVLASTYPEAPCRRRVCDREPGGHCCMQAIDIYDVIDAVRAAAEPS